MKIKKTRWERNTVSTKNVKGKKNHRKETKSDYIRVIMTVVKVIWEAQEGRNTDR
jgi:hypothetical protein